MSTQPLIILTCMRSYSSLVCGMLGQHPALVALPEINPFVAATVDRMVTILSAVRPRSLDGILRVVAETEFGEQTDATVAAARHWLEERAHWPMRRLLDHLSAILAPRRWIDKSPSTVVTEAGPKHLETILPEARVLHLVRHPIPTGASIHALTSWSIAFRRDPLVHLDPEDSWKRANIAALTIGANLPDGRYLKVRGEDLLGQPDIYFPQVLEWLGLECNADILDAMKHPERSPFARPGPPSAPFGNDPGFLNNPVYTHRPIPDADLSQPAPWREDGSRLSPRTVELARRLGYQ